MPYLRTINRQLAEASCTECNTTFTVTRDEDGGAEIETWPCQNDDHAHRRALSHVDAVQRRLSRSSGRQR